MIEKIKKILLATPGIKAKEIARKLGKEKRDINSFLYAHPNEFQADGDYGWHLKQPELEISFPTGWVDCKKFEELLAKKGSPLETTQSTIIFKIPQGSNLLLEVVGRLISLSNQLVMEGKFVIINFGEKNSTFGWVNRIGFFEHLDGKVQVLPGRPVFSAAQRYKRNSDAVVELGVIDPKNLDESIPERLKHVFVSHAGEKYEQTAFTVISELMGNVRDHSESPIPGFIGLQYYRNFDPPHIQTVISDSGKGIVGTLMPILPEKYPVIAHEIRTGTLEPEVALLKRVFSEGQISQSDDDGRGLGLKASKDAAAKFNATISVRQERCEVKFIYKNGEKTKFKHKSNLPLIKGTHICFDFELDVAV
jgi:hypothetical protein